MTESEFNEAIDAIFTELELALDQVDADLDYETTGGVLTVEFEDESKLVFSRQPANLQLWLATRSGGFHFAWDDSAGDWCDTRGGRAFRPFVIEQMRIQGGIHFAWN